jgi:hypothetical protein
VLSRKDWALNYFDNGFIPIPLCWTKKGECACFIKHTDPKQIGKGRLVKQPKGEITREMVEGWFTRYPEANIGILLKESRLVVIDADSDEAVKEFETVWANASMIPTVTTGRGKHYYFKANSETPLHRSIHKGKSGMIDIFSNGYIVAPPSVHRNGHKYVWSNPPKKTGLLNAPYWIDKFLVAETKKKTGENTQHDSIKIEITGETKIILADLPLNNFIKDIIRLGEHSSFYKQRGYKSKSEALHAMIIACYQKGLTDDQIYNIFTNPRYRLSYKYFEYVNGYRKFKELTPKEWMEDEMGRAKAKVMLRKKAKKNSRSTKTTTGAFNSI